MHSATDDLTAVKQEGRLTYQTAFPFLIPSPPCHKIPEPSRSSGRIRTGEHFCHEDQLSLSHSNGTGSA